MARRITIDLDRTEDATHGAQQLALFNGFCGGWCYLPLVAFLTFDGEPRQYLVAALLRPGTAPAPVGVRRRDSVDLLLEWGAEAARADPGVVLDTYRAELFDRFWQACNDFTREVRWDHRRASCVTQATAAC